MSDHSHAWKRRVVRICECGAQESISRGRPRGSTPKVAYKPRAETRARWQRWVEMYQSGMTGIQIAAQEGVTVASIYNALRKLGIPLHRGSDHRVPADKIAEVVRLYREEGLTYQEIGNRYGVTRECVRLWIGKSGTSAHELFMDRVAAGQAAKPTTRHCPICGETYDIGDRSHFAVGSHLKMRFGMRVAREKWDGWAADYAAGMKLKDIKAKWQSHASEIMRSVHAHGITLRRPSMGRRGTTADSKARKQRILALLREGLDHKTIAEQIGCSESWVALVNKKGA